MSEPARPPRCSICGEDIPPDKAVSTVNDQNGEPIWQHMGGCPAWSPAFDGMLGIEQYRADPEFSAPDDPVRERRLAGRRW